MEKKNAIVYFVYRLSYQNNSKFPRGIPIYKPGQDFEWEDPVDRAIDEHAIMSDRDMLPREFENREEAEKAKKYFEEIGMFDNWRVERILHHIEIL